MISWSEDQSSHAPISNNSVHAQRIPKIWTKSQKLNHFDTSVWVATSHDQSTKQHCVSFTAHLFGVPTPSLLLRVHTQLPCVRDSVTKVVFKKSPWTMFSTSCFKNGTASCLSRLASRFHRMRTLFWIFRNSKDKGIAKIANEQRTLNNSVKWLQTRRKRPFYRCGTKCPVVIAKFQNGVSNVSKL